MDAGSGTTVVILDDHPAVVDGVRSWCAAARPPIVDTGARLAVAVAGVGRAADVVVFDLQLEPGPPALRELQRLVDDGRRVVVYSQHADSDTIMRCLAIGAATYLTNDVPHQVLPLPAERAAEVKRAGQSQPQG